jgi:two-component system response regulator PilR (NtrC family)
VEIATTGEQAKKKLCSQIFDVVVSDIRIPDLSGMELLEFVRDVGPDTLFILMTAYATIETAIQALKVGAYDYIVKTDKLVDEVSLAVKRAVETAVVKHENIYLKRELRRLTALDNIVGKSPKMLEVFEGVGAVAPTNSTVLITGESGTGKELIARAVHVNSPRRDGPFITINCGAFPETLLESELFGYLKGSFTGATQNRKGLFEAATGGTLFLDEIGEMSLPMQVKLLRVLQERRLRPLGSTEETPIDVRLIAATNKDLTQLVGEKTFREDLYYRISVIPVHLPPLRERREDIAPLAMHFLSKYRQEMGKDLRGIRAEAMRRLEAYDWPGNVRELENAMERAAALEPSNLVSVDALPDRIKRFYTDHYPELASREQLPQHSLIPDGGLDLEKHMAELERAYILAALERAGGVRTRAADLLKMSYRSFRHYAKKYKI